MRRLTTAEVDLLLAVHYQWKASISSPSSLDARLECLMAEFAALAVEERESNVSILEYFLRLISCIQLSC